MASRLVKAPAVQARRTFAAQVKIKKHLLKTGKFDSDLFPNYLKSKTIFFNLLTLHRLLWHRPSVN